MAIERTPHGLPWPDGQERVRDGDDAIRALAEAVDERLTTAVIAATATPAAALLTTSLADVLAVGATRRHGDSKLIARFEGYFSNANSGGPQAATVQYDVDGAGLPEDQILVPHTPATPYALCLWQRTIVLPPAAPAPSTFTIKAKAAAGAAVYFMGSITVTEVLGL